MKLGEFIKNFSHNNIIRLWYKTKEGHEIVLETFNDVSMDWQVNNQKGKFRHYINNEVVGLTSCLFHSSFNVKHPEAINIVIERKENQEYIEEVKQETIFFESN